MISPIHTSRKQADGCYEVFYFDRLIGWVCQGSAVATGRPIWRALSVHGDLRHTRSLASARAALMEMVH